LINRHHFQRLQTSNMLPKRVRRALQLGAAAAAGGVAFLAVRALRNLADEEHEFNPLCGSKSERSSPSPNKFVNRHGLLIHWNCWLPIGKARAIIILVHGFAEHAGRYEAQGKALAEAGFAVFGLDHAGHGRSEGDRGHIRRLDDLVADVLQLADLAKEQQPGVGLFLLGHSMGGLVSILTALEKPDLWNGVVLSGPLLVPDPDVATPSKMAIAKFLSAKLPKLALDPVPAAGTCSDAAVVSAYANDPLVYHGGVRVRFAAECLEAFEKVAAKAANFKLPVLILHGADDKLCLPSGAKDFYSAISTPTEDKQLVIFPDLKHEIFFEAQGRDANGINTPFKEAMMWFQSRAEF